MPVPNPHIDLLLGDAPRHATRNLVDAPKLETRAAPESGFDWKPTVLLVGIGAAALLAFSYL